MTAARRPTQVIVAYDFSPSSEQALHRAIELAAREPGHVLHIAAVLDAHDRVTIAGKQEPPTHEAAGKIQKLIAERVGAVFAGRSTHEPVSLFVHARIGKAAPEILAIARDVGADEIFIGSHAKTGLERLLLGSVSERVVREAQCPVTVVRAKAYPDVELEQLTTPDHARAPDREPHVYSYSNRQIVMLPNRSPNG